MDGQYTLAHDSRMQAILIFDEIIKFNFAMGTGKEICNHRLTPPNKGNFGALARAFGLNLPMKGLA